jgi:hypothetical protein
LPRVENSATDSDRLNRSFLCPPSKRTLAYSERLRRFCRAEQHSLSSSLHTAADVNLSHNQQSPLWTITMIVTQVFRKLLTDPERK